VELVNADPGSAATAAMPDRFFTVEELYNTNRNPAELGTVHPLVYENEDSLVGQLGYNVGALMNSDKHAMVWCRNFDGGRSFTTTLQHSWQFVTETWFQEQMLARGQVDRRCRLPQLRDLQRGVGAAHRERGQPEH
jgi:Trehalose utilisation